MNADQMLELIESSSADKKERMDKVEMILRSALDHKKLKAYLDKHTGLDLDLAIDSYATPFQTVVDVDARTDDNRTIIASKHMVIIPAVNDNQPLVDGEVVKMAAKVNSSARHQGKSVKMLSDKTVVYKSPKNLKIKPEDLFPASDLKKLFK